MATKKQNRRAVVRAARRVLNRTVGDVKGTRNGILKTGYGRGLNIRSVRIEKED